MTPVTRCLQKVDHASVVTDTTVVERVGEALTELEAAYHRPSEKIVALEQVLQQITRQRSVADTPFGQFIESLVERRQNLLAHRSA